MFVVMKKINNFNQIDQYSFKTASFVSLLVMASAMISTTIFTVALIVEIVVDLV